MLFISFQLSRSVMSDSLQLHGLQHTRPPCPSPTLGACSNSCPLSQWHHPTNLSAVTLFSSCPQLFPAPERRLLKQGHGVSRDLDGKNSWCSHPSLKFSSYAKNAVNSSQNYPRWQAFIGVHCVQATLGKTEAVALPYERWFSPPFLANFTTEHFL